MSQIADTIGRVRAAAKKVGLAELARQADVPYTTVKSFEARGWSNKNLDVLERLADAAAKIDARPAQDAAA